MASITLTATNECTAQNHVTITVTGDVPHIEHYTYSDITEPVTDEEKRAFLRVLLKIAKIGRTTNQVRVALQSGYVVTI